jgi:hypothetical protein
VILELSIEELAPDEKLRIAKEISDTMVRVSADGIRAENPDIPEKELLQELRLRIRGED